MPRALIPALLMLCVGAAAATARDVDERLDALVSAHPDHARVEVLGASLRGRPLRALVLAAGDRPLVERRGLLAVAGLDGRRLGDADLLLDVAEDLLGRDDLAELLGGQALVLIPRANPDGAAASAGLVGPARATAGNRRPDDADRDGRGDEDGPADLDGDGLITWMRVPDGAGEWLVDEHDPRALRGAEDDERGTHRLVREGRDDDGDGDQGEDGDEGVELDRNFPHGFEEYQAAAGAYPLSEPEALTLATFVRAHPGLRAVLVLGAHDTLVSAPGKAKKVDRGGFGGFRSPLDGLLEEDVAVVKALGEAFQEAAEGTHDAKGDGPTDGSFLAWAYHQAGRWPLAVRTWAPPTKLPAPETQAADDDAADDDGEDAAADDTAEADDGAAAEAGEDADSAADDDGEADDTADEDGADEDGADEDGADDDAADDDTADNDAPATKPTSDPDSPVPAAVLAWLDGDHEGAGIVPWTPFDHPDLGPVEIGGLAPTVLHDLPDEAREALAPRLAAFVVELLDTAPELVLEELEVEARGAGLYALSAVLVNVGELPTAPRFAADARLARPVRVRLDLPEGVELANGPPQTLVRHLAPHGGRQELRWLLAGAAPGQVVTLTADADTTADLSQEVTLP